MDGFVKIYRKFTEWEWYQDTNTKVVFLHLLLKASFKDSKFQGGIIKKGEVVTSISRLSNELNMSQQAVRTALKHLEKTEEIHKQSTSKLTIITIRKYSVYQGLNETDQQATNKQLTSDQQATNKQLTTLEECKEIKKVRNKEIYNPPIIPPTANQIIELYNQICISYPRCTKLSDSRKRAVNARLNSGVTLDDFKKAFEKAQSSDFLRGKNSRNWIANFDWMVKDANLAKILDGNYDNKTDRSDNNEPNRSSAGNSSETWNLSGTLEL